MLPSSYDNKVYSTTPIEDWIRGWIPLRMALTMWPNLDGIKLKNEEHQNYFNLLSEENDLIGLLFENEFELSKIGKVAIIIDLDDMFNITLSPGKIVNINYEKRNKVASAMVLKEINTGGLNTYWITEYHTKNMIKRQSGYGIYNPLSPNFMTPKQFLKDTGFLINPLTQHNKGVVLVEPFENLGIKSKKIPQDDLANSSESLNKLDIINFRIKKELEEAGSKLIYDSGKSMLHINTKTLENAKIKWKKDPFFDLGVFGAKKPADGGNIEPIFQSASYEKSLDFLDRAYDREMGRLFNTIGDHETEFEGTGVVQQNNFEREQQESSKILSLVIKTRCREKSLKNLIQKIGILTGKLPILIKDINIKLNPSNISFADMKKDLSNAKIKKDKIPNVSKNILGEE